MFHPQGPSFWELAVQALSATDRGYDLLAPKFDFTPFRTPDFLLEAVRPHIGGARSIDTALDVCCGTGAGMQLLRPLCRKQVTGIDFSEGMLEVAKKHLASKNSNCVTTKFVHGDVLEMEFHEEFDVATCFGALGHILPRDQERFVRRIHAALRPGGRFVFATANQLSKLDWRYWSARGFNAAMHVRNLLIRPPFIMFYLTFLLPQARHLLEANGFSVEVRTSGFERPFDLVEIVIATKMKNP